MKTSETLQTGSLDAPSIVLSPDDVESAALKRILAEVVDDRDLAVVPNCYDRDHNRHNR